MKKLAALLPGLALWAAGLHYPAQAQSPRLTATTPAPFAPTPRTAEVQATFSEPVTGAADIRLFTNQWRGHRAGTFSGDGTATLGFRPQQVLAPGERARLTIPATVRSAGAGGGALAGGQVVEFRAAAGPATGTFSSAGPRINGSFTGTYDLTLADMDNDGNLDLLYADNAGFPAMQAQLRLGDGRGGFGPVRNAGLSEGLTVADLNGDGNLDVLSTGLLSTGFNGMLARYGDGNGGFLASSYQIQLTAKAVSPRVGDLNGDGIPDLVLMEFAPITTSGGGPARLELVVRLGNGTGGFTTMPNLVLAAPGTLPAAFNPRGLHLSDLNNDGRLDILYSATGTGSQRTTYLGNGLGGFAAAAGGGVASAPVEELADLTGDGILDIVTAAAGSQVVSIYAGLGTGAFAATPTTTFTLANPKTGPARAADVDGDGDLDLLVGEARPSTGNPPIQSTRPWLNNGTGTFASSPAVDGANNLLATGDVNNDGTLDAVVLLSDGSLQGFQVFVNAPLATAPTLSGFTPASGSTGTVVTLTGTNFTGATLVTLNGVPITGFTVVNGTTITFTVPAGASPGLVTVTTATGTATSLTRLTLTGTGMAALASQALPGLTLHPNPTHDRLTVTLPTPSPATVTLRDLAGRLLLAEAPLPASGLVALPATLAAGVYLLEVRQGSKLAVRRFTKQ